MPVPIVRAVGAITSGTGTITLGEPAGAANGDLQIMQIESDPADAAVTCTGWAHIPGSPVNQDSALTTDTSLSMLYRIRSGAGTLTTNDPGDHIIGRMINIMAGTYDQGNPFNAIGTGTDTTEDTSASVPGAVTTIRDCLILIAIASGFDRAANATTEYSGFTNSNLTSITERIDNARIDGNGGTIGMASASYAGPGDYGATTATLANASLKAMMSVAINPAPPTALPSKESFFLLMGAGGLRKFRRVMEGAPGVTPPAFKPQIIRVRG